MVFKVKRGSLLAFEVRENNIYYVNSNSEDENDIFFCLCSQKNVKREREHGLVSEGPSPRQEEKKATSRFGPPTAFH